MERNYLGLYHAPLKNGGRNEKTIPLAKLVKKPKGLSNSRSHAAEIESELYRFTAFKGWVIRRITHIVFNCLDEVQHISCCCIVKFDEDAWKR